MEGDVGERDERIFRRIGYENIARRHSLTVKYRNPS